MNTKTPEDLKQDATNAVYGFIKFCKVVFWIVVVCVVAMFIKLT
jgi:hypothetical protein